MDPCWAQTKQPGRRKLETFPNHSRIDYTVTLTTDEFTCVCPMTGQPDFAKITIEYIPDKKIVESKSLKLYFWSFRNEGVFHEHVTNIILDDLVAALSPRWCKVTAALQCAAVSPSRWMRNIVKKRNKKHQNWSLESGFFRAWATDA